MTSADFTSQTIKMEPMVRNRKRNISQASWSSSNSVSSSTMATKKVKKYELDPSTDPTVKNALAAKLNREKKKQEEAKLKTENEALKFEKELLEKQLEASVNRQIELVRMLEEEKKKNALALATGPFPIQSSDSFLQSVMNNINNQTAAEEEVLEEVDAITTADVLPHLNDLGDCLDLDMTDFFPNPDSPEKEVKPFDCYSFNQLPASSTWTTNQQDPLMSIPLKTPGDVLSENTYCSPNLWDVIKTMALTPMDL